MQLARTKKFSWRSKQDLYRHFETEHALDRDAIDHEIEHAMKSFKLRKGQPINTQELWEKVGKNIERKLTNQQHA
jgi:hypothetical protein